MALRALDDIKESVRAAAVTLARALRSLTVRVTDKGQSSAADAAEAVSIALPLLLEKGGALDARRDLDQSQPLHTLRDYQVADERE